MSIRTPNSSRRIACRSLLCGRPRIYRNYYRASCSEFIAEPESWIHTSQPSRNFPSRAGFTGPLADSACEIAIGLHICAPETRITWESFRSSPATSPPAEAIL
jgi:hypothetical protein